MTQNLAQTLMSAAATLALLSACAVGPDFERPAPPVSQHYDVQAEQHVAFDGKIEGNWWSTFRSAKLEQTMRQAIAGNLDLAAADATISQANEAVIAARGGLYPQADFGVVGGRQRAGGATGNFYTVGPRVSF